MIEVRNLSKRFGKFVAVDSVSFTAGAGEILALVGPNGSGKSTTMKCIAGLVAPTAGEIFVNGNLVTDQRRDWLSYLPQKVHFPENLTGREIVEFYSRLRKLPAAANQRALEISQLNGFGSRAVREYSGGMLQRLGIGIALMPEASVVVMDEPTASLDPDAVLRLRELLLEMRARGQTIIVSSHALSEVETLADRVAILVRGRVVACDPIRKFRENLEQETRMRISVARPRAELCSLVGDAGAISAEIAGSELLVTAPPASHLAVLRALEGSGARVERFTTEGPSLETLYLRYTRESRGVHSDL